MKTNLFSMYAPSVVKAIQQQLRRFGSFVKKIITILKHNMSQVNGKLCVSISFSDQTKQKKRNISKCEQDEVLSL